MAKLPTLVLRKEIHPDVYIGITYLSRIAGLEISGVFHEWMFTYIQSLRHNKGTYDWALFISDSIHHAIEETSEHFYMSSYIVYACAKSKHSRVEHCRTFGNRVTPQPNICIFPTVRKERIYFI